MEPYKIVLLTLLLLAFVYFVVLVYVLSSVVTFSKRMKRRLRALDILLSEKALQLQTASEEFRKLDVKLSPSDEEAMKELSTLKFEKSTYDSVVKNRSVITAAEKHISYLALTHKEISTNEWYLEWKNGIDDLDRNLRRCSVLYNSDLVGYNYWISIPGTRLLVYICRFRKGKNIA